MTTTTRTTRKAPWAVFLTALLAALALVLGSLVIAAPANAKDNPKPDNPGNSANAPGHQDGTTVPPGHDPEFVPPGQEDRPTTDKKVWICHADTNNGNGQPNLGVNGTGGENKKGFNILYISTSAWENGHQGRHPSDQRFDSEAAAIAYCGMAPTPKYYCPPDSLIKTELGHEYTESDRAFCYPAVPTSVDKTVCVVTGTVDGVDTYGMVKFTGSTDRPEDTWVNGTTPLSAYKQVNSALCVTPDQQAAIDAAVAAMPQPATVAAPAPGTIKVPAKGPTIPATVPAGDGSTAPTTPVAALTFLVLAATALAASTVRLVGAKR